LVAQTYCEQRCAAD